MAYDRRRRWSNLVLLALVVGLVFFFPSLRREEIEFRTELEQPKCVERVEIRVFKGEELQRSNSELVRNRDVVVQVAKLARGEYRAVLSVDCRDGSTAIASMQPIIVDREGVIQFKVSGAECRCSEW